MHALKFNVRTLLYTLVASMVVIGLTSIPAQAASSKPATVEKKAQGTPQEMESELQQIGMQLTKIQKKAIASSPKLQAKRHHFSKHMVSVMKKLGYTPGADTKKLMDIKKSILSGKLNKDEREAQVRKFVSIRQHMMKGQIAALKDKSLSQEGKMLHEATLVAMRKTDPHTDDLIKRFDVLSTKLRAVMINEAKAKAKK